MKLLLTLFFVLSGALEASVDQWGAYAPGPKLPKKRFVAIISLFEKEFSPLAQKDNRELVFYTDYNENWAQAFARRWETDQVIVYGGMAALNNGSEDSFALVLCHELGHLYGGMPFSDAYNRLAVEGQADYWATEVCMPQILPKISELDPQARTLDAALVLSAFFADNRNLAHPKISTPDTSVVERVLLTHPSPQCRLDTYWAGIFKDTRPACWFREVPAVLSK